MRVNPNRALRYFRPETEEHGSKKWSRWIHPIPDNYLMACCDCGLVHEFQFRPLRIVKRIRKDVHLYEDLKSTTHRIKFRARRAEKHTRDHRKNRGLKCAV